MEETDLAEAALTAELEKIFLARRGLESIFDSMARRTSSRWMSLGRELVGEGLGRDCLELDRPQRSD